MNSRPTPTATADRPALTELLARARALRPLVRERAAQTERERRVSAKVTALLTDAGLYRVLQPARFGGYEYGLDDVRQLAFEVGQACASTGWCFALGATSAWVLGMFPDEAQHDVWDRTPDALAAGCIAPTGQAVATEGGWRLRGRWSFASNCDNSGWAYVGAMQKQAEGEPPRAMLLLVPESEYRVIDNWHTVGLAGTGSKDIAIEEEIFVPAHRCVTFAQVLEQDAPGARVNANPLYRVPFLSGFPAMLAIPAVAALRGAVDEFVAGMAPRSTRGAFAGSGSSLAQFGHVQSAVAEADAAVDAAQLILQRDLQVAATLAAQGKKLDTGERIAVRRGHAYSVRLCVSAIDALYAVVGGTGIHLDNAVQRAWRDINALAHHIGVNWHAVSTLVGQERLGLPLRGQY